MEVLRKPVLLILSLLVMRAAPAQVEPSFIATTSFGIQVPVYVYNGKSSAYDFSLNVLDQNESQGILILLGRDKDRLWYIQAGYSNDAAEESWFMNLASIDTVNPEKIFPTEVNSRDTTHAMRFHTAFAKLFKRHKLDKLIPVEAWAPPEPYYFIAQVNCKELNRCFEFNFLVDSEDNGTCVFYFEWDVLAGPYQQTRRVIFTDCVLTIPSDWTYFPDNEARGYVAHQGDTLSYNHWAAITYLPYEMVEYKFANYDSSLYAKRNSEIRAYNDSLRRANPMMVTHEQKNFYLGDTTIRTIVPKKGNTGRMLMEVHADRTRFVLSTTVLTAEEQFIFGEVMESWELR